VWVRRRGTEGGTEILREGGEGEKGRGGENSK